MRYSARLHSSRKKHVLKHHVISTAIGMILFGIIFSFLLVLGGLNGLDIHTIASGLIISLVRVSAAYAISLIFAVAMAILITANQYVENIFLPIFDVLQSFPSFALFPLLVVALARYPETVIILVLALEIIWPILFSIIGAFKNIREDLEEAATIFGATGMKRLIHFTLPYLRPSIVTGSIVGWGEAWEFIIGAELLVHINSGIGHYLGELGSAGKNSLLFWGIAILMLFLFILNKLIWLPLLNSSSRYQTES